MSAGKYRLQDQEVRELGRDGLLAGGAPAITQPGQSEALGPDPKTGVFTRRVDLLRCEGEDALAMNTTVVLSLDRENPPTEAARNQTYPVFASILFGVGGTATRCEVDFLNGAVITLPCSSIFLAAQLDVPDDEVLFPIVARAFISYLPMANSRQSQRTLRATLGIGASVVMPVPMFGQIVTLLGSAPGSAFVLEQYRDALATMLVATQPVPAVPPNYDIPLANETRYVKITNTGPITTVRAIFGLYL